MRFGGDVPVQPGPAVPGIDRCQHCYANIYQPEPGSIFVAVAPSGVNPYACEGAPNVPHKRLPKVSADA